MNLSSFSKEELIEIISKLEDEILSNKERIDELTKDHHFFRTLMDNIPDVIYFKDIDSKFVKINKALARYFGLVDTSLANGKTDFDFFTNEHSLEAFQDEQNVIRKGISIIDKEEKGILIDGDTIWQSTTKMPLIDDSGIVIGTFGISRDITKRKSLDNLLVQNERLLRSILDNALVRVAILNLDLSFKTANKSYSELLGYQVHELEKIKITDLTHPDNLEKTRNNLHGILQKQIRKSKFENKYIHKSNKVIDIITCTWPVYDDNDEPLYIIETLEDISEKKRTENEIRMLADAMKSISECVSITDMNNTILFVNEAFLKTYGYERDELIGSNIDIVRPHNNPAFMNDQFIISTLRGGWQGEIFNRRKDGREFPIHLSSSVINDENKKPIALIGISVDITEKKRFQAEINKALRLESLGTLAGGIAHDFNNILVGILGNVSLAKRYAENNQKIYKKLNDIEIASLRAKELSNNLVTFSKGGVPFKEVSSIIQLIKDSVQNSLNGSNSHCEFFIPDDLWEVEFDKNQIKQAIKSIIMNSDESMPGGGRITVGAENIILPVDLTNLLSEGKYIKISIGDHGVGIPNENLHKIFDPFFSTKFQGRGIGLSTAYSIIKKHNGKIEVASIPGKETIISIYLPVYCTKKNVIENEKTLITSEVKRSCKVLVMDDEEIVRDFFEEFLSYSGYDLGLAKDGEEAIEMFKNAKENKSPFEIVILDLTVPQNLGAKQTIEKMLKIDPNIKAIVSSGYSDDVIMSSYKSFGFKAALNKPFKIEEISLILENLTSE